jgi:hypothetical protein
VFEPKSYLVLPNDHTFTHSYTLKEALELARAIARADKRAILTAEVTGRRWLVHPDTTDAQIAFICRGA